MGKCRYCNRESEREFCSFEHKKKFEQKEEETFIQFGARKNFKESIGESDRKLQAKFLKKLGKKEIKKKLIISEGIL